MSKNILSLENVKIMFPNFKGLEGKFNPAGKRTFVIFIDDMKLAKGLDDDGWNIKFIEDKDDPENINNSVARLQVNVSYKIDNLAPKIYWIKKDKKILLDEESIEMLDTADITSCDVILNPYNWSVNGKTGTTAYLKCMYVTILEDEFAQKYDELPIER